MDKWTNGQMDNKAVFDASKNSIIEIIILYYYNNII